MTVGQSGPHLRYETRDYRYRLLQRYRGHPKVGLRMKCGSKAPWTAFWIGKRKSWVRNSSKPSSQTSPLQIDQASSLEIEIPSWRPLQSSEAERGACRYSSYLLAFRLAASTVECKLPRCQLTLLGRSDGHRKRSKLGLDLWRTRKRRIKPQIRLPLQQTFWYYKCATAATSQNLKGISLQKLLQSFSFCLRSRRCFCHHYQRCATLSAWWALSQTWQICLAAVCLRVSVCEQCPKMAAPWFLPAFREPI